MLVAVNEVRPPVILATLAVIVSLPPDVLHHRHDGAVHAPDGGERAARHAHEHDRRVHHHAVDELPCCSRAHAGHAGPDADDGGQGAPAGAHRLFKAVLSPFLRSRAWRTGMVVVILALLAFSGLLVVWRRVPLKMLPFDNKNEFQVMLDLPEGTPLEETAAAVGRRGRAPAPRAGGGELLGARRRADRPWTSTAWCASTTCARRPTQADIRVNLAPKTQREMQSHAMLLRVRRELEKVAESPRGAA